jgi:toxin FitB
MKIIDTNILIYSNLREYHNLRVLFEDKFCYFSEITKLEALGFHKITNAEKTYFTNVFNFANIVKIDSEVVELAISLRQVRKLSIGDAIIAATAILYDLELVTRNTKDFDAIKGLRVSNPLG